MKEGYGREYASLYHTHWWWRAREALLLDVLHSLSLPPAVEVLDVGCGDGLFFPRLEEFGRVRGIEVDERLLDPEGAYRSRIFTEPLGDARYARWRFGLITALDVLEHIDDDRAAVAAMGGMLDREGHLVVTVPAFMSLWDRHDEINQHCRRYTSFQLRALLEPVGTVLQVRYWFHSLYFAKRAVAVLNRRRGTPITQHRLPPPPLNSLLRDFCRLEARALRRLRLPFGTTVLAVVRRQ